MSMLDEIVTKYDFAKLNTLTKYPSVLSYHDDEKRLSTADYQPIPPHPENMQIVARELIDGNLIRIIILDNDYFVGDANEIIHARGDRIITNSLIIPMYKSFSGFFNANLSNQERMMVLFGVVYGGERYGFYDDEFAQCQLIDGFTIKVQDIIGICRDNSINDIQNWVDTLHQPFWTTSTLARFSDTCQLNQLPNLIESTLDAIPVEYEQIKTWIKSFQQSSLSINHEDSEELVQSRAQQKNISFNDLIKEADKNKVDINSIGKTDNNGNGEDEEDDLDFFINGGKKQKQASTYKKSKGLVIRALDRSYVRKIKFSDYSSN